MQLTTFYDPAIGGPESVAFGAHEFVSSSGFTSINVQSNGGGFSSSSSITVQGQFAQTGIGHDAVHTNIATNLSYPVGNSPEPSTGGILDGRIIRRSTDISIQVPDVGPLVYIPPPYVGSDFTNYEESAIKALQLLFSGTDPMQLDRAAGTRILVVGVSGAFVAQFGLAGAINVASNLSLVNDGYETFVNPNEQNRGSTVIGVTSLVLFRGSHPAFQATINVTTGVVGQMLAPIPIE